MDIYDPLANEDTLDSLEEELNDLHRERDAAHDAGDDENVLELERQIQVLEDELAEVLAPFGGTVRSR